MTPATVYRRLLVTYPREYRQEHQAEILAILDEAAEPGRRRPSAREALGLLVGGLRIRALLAARKGGRSLCNDGLRIAVVLLLGARLSTYTAFLFPILRPGIDSSLPLVVQVTATATTVLLALALLAVVRGAIRTSLILTLAAGVASMPWGMSGLFLESMLGSGPLSPDTAQLALASVLLLTIHSLWREQAPWSWWLPAAMIAAPMLDTQVHFWYGHFVLSRLDGPHELVFSTVERFIDSLIGVAVPCLLFAWAVIARDPRPSIAAVVSAGAGLVAMVYATVAIGFQFHGYNWSAIPDFLTQPGLVVAVGVVITVATMRTDQRAVPR